MEYVSAFDDAVLAFLGQFAAKNAAFNLLVLDFVYSALLKGCLYMAAFWALWFSAEGDLPARRRRIVIAMIAAVAATLMSRAMEQLMAIHERPFGGHVPAFVMPLGLNTPGTTNWNSFPADHAVVFGALSFALWYEKKALGVVALLWTIFLVGLPRVYTGYNYPSDVIGGIALGAAVLVASHVLVRGTSLPDRVIGWERGHRALFYAVAFVATYEIGILLDDLRGLAGDGVRLFESAQTRPD
jgi:undecaprenyl-diphosphatase